MRVVCLIVSLLMTVIVHGTELKLQEVRVSTATDKTRVVFDLSQLAQHRWLYLDKPDRVVIDLKNTRSALGPLAKVKDNRYLKVVQIRRLNSRDIRIVLALKQPSRVDIFQLEPNSQKGHRLVVDLVSKVSPKLVKSVSHAANQTYPTISKTNAKSRDVIVAIDAGHGGVDPGAIGPAGTKEKDIVLQIAKKLTKRINSQRGMRAVLIRDSDKFIRLRRRIKKARKYKADVFVSIHADAFKDHRVKGSSVYVLSKRGASSEAAKWLAKRENAADLLGGVPLDNKEKMVKSVLLDLSQTASLDASIDIADKILKGLSKVGKTHKKRVQSAGFAVLKAPDIPSILIETAFISNPQEEKKLLNSSYQTRLVNAVAQGLRNYFVEYAPADTLLAMRRHRIKGGDTLSEIAQQYRVSLSALRRFNGLKNDLVRVGQVLTIPTS